MTDGRCAGRGGRCSSNNFKQTARQPNWAAATPKPMRCCPYGAKPWTPWPLIRRNIGGPGGLDDQTLVAATVLRRGKCVVAGSLAAFAGPGISSSGPDAQPRLRPGPDPGALGNSAPRNRSARPSHTAPANTRAAVRSHTLCALLQCPDPCSYYMWIGKLSASRAATLCTCLTPSIRTPRTRKNGCNY